MGTTATVLVLRDGHYLIGQVGDGRAYLLRDRQLVQLTKDHSYVQELMDAGLITPDQAGVHAPAGIRKACHSPVTGPTRMARPASAGDGQVPASPRCRFGPRTHGPAVSEQSTDLRPQAFGHFPRSSHGRRSLGRSAILTVPNMIALHENLLPARRGPVVPRRVPRLP